MKCLFEAEITQIYSQIKTNPYGKNYKDLTDLNRFVGFLAKRLLIST